MAATRGGAFDYLAKPFEMDDLLDIVRRAAPNRRMPSRKTTNSNLKSL